MEGAFCCPVPLTKHPETRGGINKKTTLIRVYFSLIISANNHGVNVGNKKGARYALDTQNISHASNKLDTH